MRSAPSSPLVYFCMRLALLRYLDILRIWSGRKPRKKLFPNTKAEVLHVSLAFLQPWRYYMCDEVGFIPDYKIPQMWVHWDLKPCCVLIVSCPICPPHLESRKAFFLCPRLPLCKASQTFSSDTVLAKWGLKQKIYRLIDNIGIVFSFRRNQKVVASSFNS